MARSKGRPGNRLNALGKGQTGNDDSKEPPRKRRRTNEGVKLNKQSTKAQKNAKAPNQRVDGNKVKDTKGESIAGLSGQNQDFSEVRHSVKVPRMEPRSSRRPTEHPQIKERVELTDAPNPDITRYLHADVKPSVLKLQEGMRYPPCSLYKRVRLSLLYITLITMLLGILLATSMKLKSVRYPSKLVGEQKIEQHSAQRFLPFCGHTQPVCSCIDNGNPSNRINTIHGFKSVCSFAANSKIPKTICYIDKDQEMAMYIYQGTYAFDFGVREKYHPNTSSASWAWCGHQNLYTGYLVCEGEGKAQHFHLGTKNSRLVLKSGDRHIFEAKCME